MINMYMGILDEPIGRRLPKGYQTCKKCGAYEHRGHKFVYCQRCGGLLYDEKEWTWRSILVRNSGIYGAGPRNTLMWICRRDGLGEDTEDLVDRFYKYLGGWGSARSRGSDPRDWTHIDGHETKLDDKSRLLRWCEKCQEFHHYDTISWRREHKIPFEDGRGYG